MTKSTAAKTARKPRTPKVTINVRPTMVDKVQPTHPVHGRGPKRP